MKIESEYRKELAKANCIVIKVGTRVITQSTGEPDLN